MIFLAQGGGLKGRDCREGEHRECAVLSKICPWQRHGLPEKRENLFQRGEIRPNTPCIAALTVSVVGGGQVGRGAAIDDGVGRQVCKEGQSPHQPCSICQGQPRVRSCQPRAPPASSWGQQLILESAQGSEMLGLTPHPSPARVPLSPGHCLLPVAPEPWGLLDLWKHEQAEGNATSPQPQVPSMEATYCSCPFSRASVDSSAACARLSR